MHGDCTLGNEAVRGEAKPLGASPLGIKGNNMISSVNLSTAWSILGDYLGLRIRQSKNQKPLSRCDKVV